MPITISKRVLFTFAGALVIVTFIHDGERYDYPYEPGRGVVSEADALHRLEQSGHMDTLRTQFLADVYLGREPHDVELTPAAKEGA